MPRADILNFKKVCVVGTTRGKHSKILTFSFEATVDSRAVVRNNGETHVPLTPMVSPHNFVVGVSQTCGTEQLRENFLETLYNTPSTARVSCHFSRRMNLGSLGVLTRAGQFPGRGSHGGA